MAAIRRKGGNFGPEWVAAIKRNGGSFAPEYAIIAGGAPIHVQTGVMRAEFIGTERDEAIVKVLRAMRDASCSSI